MKPHRGRLAFFIVILISYLGFGGYYAYHLQNEGKLYKINMEKSVHVMGTLDRFTDSREWVDAILENFEINPLFNKWKESAAKSKYFENEAMAHKENAKRWSWFFASLSLAVLLITLTLYLAHFFVHGYMAMMTIAVSMVCLWVGISSPMMELFAYNEGIAFNLYKGTLDLIVWKKDYDIDLDFQGKFYHYYQCKSVLDVIHLLFTAKNYLVGVAILLFSIIFPILKLMVSFTAMAFPSTHNFKITRIIIHKLGKWSMADVFVVALFLAFLAFQNISDQVETDARILPGLYYFLSFSVLSISSSFFVDKAIRKNNEETERLLMMQMQRDEISPDVG